MSVVGGGGGGAVVAVVGGGGAVVGGGGGGGGGATVVDGAGGAVVRVTGRLAGEEVVGGSDVVVEDVAVELVDAWAAVVVGDSEVVDVVARWTCAPSTRTGWRAVSANGPMPAESATSATVDAATTHQNHRPSRTRPTDRGR